MAELGREFIKVGDSLIAFIAQAPFVAIVVVLVVTALLRFLPREQARPLRFGFFIVAPLVACIIIATGVVAGWGAFLLIMFGPPLLFNELRVMPWFTMFLAVPLGPAIGLAMAVGVAVLGDRLLGRV